MTPLDDIELALKAPVVRANLKQHVFVCTGSKCEKRDSEATLDRFYELLAQKGLLYGKKGSKDGTVIVSKSGSVGLCAVGPAVMVYPQGVWYYGVTPDDVAEIVDTHLIGGKIVDRLLALHF